MGLERDFEGSFREDRFRGVSGPISIPPEFIKALHDIDDRLVVRWMPPHNCYMIWLKMERSHLLWCQPVGILRDSLGRPRKPTGHDIYKIRQANWLSRHTGARAAIDNMDRQIADQQRARDDHIKKVSQDWAAENAKKYDLTYSDMGVTRKAMTSAGRSDGLEA